MALGVFASARRSRSGPLVALLFLTLGLAAVMVHDGRVHRRRMGEALTNGELEKHRRQVQQLSSQALETQASLDALKKEKVALEFDGAPLLALLELLYLVHDECAVGVDLAEQAGE